MDGHSKGVRKINTGTVSENLTKGLFPKLKAGLREATRDGGAQETSNPGQRLPHQGQGQRAFTGTQQDLQLQERASKQESGLSVEKSTHHCPTEARQGGSRG